MKILKMWFVVALLACAAPALADPPAQVGRLSYLSGTVSFAPAEAASDWGVASLNRPVTTGDRLWADQDGRAEIRIGSTALRAGALTSLDVLQLDEGGTQLRLAQGTLSVSLRRLDAGENFEISTPGGAVLLTRPGNYRVSVDGSGVVTAVLVRAGQADVLTGNAPLSVRDNQQATFSAQGQDLTSAPPPDEFDAWALARDRQDERLVATRYVPQEMTGYEDLDQHGAWQSAPQYGDVWIPTTVAAGWAPYRDGRWVWISPWGWTWVDNAPWGFAPYHYGRWVWLGNRWAWAPGARVARPVYAPALVAFVGGAGLSLGIGAGPAVGWVPLGWGEPFIPWYRTSPAYVRNVNITHVTNVTVINQYSQINNAARIRYVNRDVPSATTVVTRDTFVSARRVSGATLNVPISALAAAQVTHVAPVARPERASFMAARSGARLPAAVEAREVVANRTPVAPEHLQQGGGARFAGAVGQPRVRVLSAQSPRASDAAAAQPANAQVTSPFRSQPAPVLPSSPAVPVAPVAPPAVQGGRRDRGDERAPGQPTNPRAGAPIAAPPAASQAVAPPVTPQPNLQQQQEHQRQLEQQRQARAQAQQLQQQKLQEQKEHQHQLQQQRAQEVQQQRDRQFQQAQQAEQQRQLQRQQQLQQRQAERTPAPPPAARAPQAAPAPATTTAPPPHARRPGEPERPPQSH